MQIQAFFINGDMKGAIAYMREHEEFQDILPAYIAIFENCEYRTYDVPEFLNQILLLYQVYSPALFCGSDNAGRPAGFLPTAAASFDRSPQHEPDR